MKSAEIRKLFLEFFAGKGHAVVPSSSLIPLNDQTLLFTNAGMVQFKDALLGLEKRDYSRATTSQKCMRVSGKHNDLETVGPSPRHHTFFEMLGNFSFGDYFKKGAIQFAYECLTGTFGIPPERLYYTVHEQDDDAFGYWVDDMGIDPARVYRMGDSTNFWMMGDTGPCGPTAELHYDWGPEFCTCGEPDCSVLLDNGCDRWLEVWNLVFMQYNQAADGSRTPLPQPGIDTGMGLERLTSILQGVHSTYETDLFTPVMEHTRKLLGHTVEQMREHVVDYRVIADHGRAVTFLVGDGILPGNEGRNYVLRLILRRAARHGKKAGFEGPFLAKIADRFIEEMGEHYTDLVKRRQFILNVVNQEEERFQKTLDTGLKLLDDLMAESALRGEKGGAVISGEDAFRLYDTYGFPVDLTRNIAEEHGLTVDMKGYYEALAQQKERSRAAGRFAAADEETVRFYSGILKKAQADGHFGSGSEGVAHDPYGATRVDTKLLAIIRDGRVVDEAGEGEEVDMLIAKTPFYVESGGQVDDVGHIISYNQPGFDMEVTALRNPIPGLILHHGRMLNGTAHTGEQVSAMVDDERRNDIRRNHTATHILHRELRRVLGDHVQQAGSLVEPSRLRFDFTHPETLSAEEMGEVEASVNEAVLRNYPVVVERKSYQQAVDGGALAFFEEKYGEVVRVVRIGELPNLYSQELCGGTHVSRTGDIGSFHVVSEGSVAAGVRRIEAVTGRGAYRLAQRRIESLDRTAAFLGCAPEEVPERVEAMQERAASLSRTIARQERQIVRQSFERMMAEGLPEVSGVKVLAGKIEVRDVSMLREMTDWFREGAKSGVAVLATVTPDDRVNMVVSVSKDLVGRGLHAGNLSREVAKLVGGGGGGNPTMAQAGGRDASKLDEALRQVPGLVQKAIS